MKDLGCPHPGQYSVIDIPGGYGFDPAADAGLASDLTVGVVSAFEAEGQPGAAEGDEDGDDGAAQSVLAGAAYAQNIDGDWAYFGPDGQLVGYAEVGQDGAVVYTDPDGNVVTSMQSAPGTVLWFDPQGNVYEMDVSAGSAEPENAVPPPAPVSPSPPDLPPPPYLASFVVAQQNKESPVRLPDDGPQLAPTVSDVPAPLYQTPPSQQAPASSAGPGAAAQAAADAADAQAAASSAVDVVVATEYQQKLAAQTNAWQPLSSLSVPYEAPTYAPLDDGPLVEGSLGPQYPPGVEVPPNVSRAFPNGLGAPPVGAVPPSWSSPSSAVPLPPTNAQMWSQTLRDIELGKLLNGPPSPSADDPPQGMVGSAWMGEVDGTTEPLAQPPPWWSPGMTSADLWDRLIQPQLAVGTGISPPPEDWAEELRLQWATMTDAEKQRFAEQEWSSWRGPHVSQPMPPGWDALAARLARYGLDEAENDAALQGFTEADLAGLSWKVGRYAVGKAAFYLEGELTARGVLGGGAEGAGEVAWGGRLEGQAIRGGVADSGLSSGFGRDVAPAPLGAGSASPHEFISKVVNTEMGHASLRAVERAGFPSIRDAREALQEFGRNLEAQGTLPPEAIFDPAHADRVIVPGFGQGGAVVYQVTKDGVYRLKTVLMWNPVGAQ